MIKRTFCHIPGIGPITEQHLWDSGVTTWEDYLSASAPQLPPKREVQIKSWIEKSVSHYGLQNPKFFAELLPSAEMWRMYPDFRTNTAYLDIETTGLSPDYDSITTIVLYDGKSIKHYVKGQNLPQFKQDICQYKQIVTYNGKTFDIPFIEAKMGLRLEHAHIDLRYVLHSLGIVGGLKGSERRLGIRREGLEDIDGYMAVLLWKEYKKQHDQRALETLLAYNTADAVNLEAIAIHAFNRKLRNTPFLKEDSIELPPSPINPFRPYSSIVRKIGRMMSSPW